MSVRQVKVTRKGGATQGSAASGQPNGLSSGKTSPHQLIEQARAAYALAWIQKAGASGEIKQGELKSFTRRLPGMIQVNGFGQAMAFYYAKRSKSAACQAVYDFVETWLCGPHAYQHTTGTPFYADHARATPALLTAITAENQQRYRHAQAETQALLRWAKKFAEALVKEDEVPE